MFRVLRVFIAIGLGLGAAASAAAQTPVTVEYYHLDAIGSVRAVTDQQGQVIRRHDYLPFGEEYLAGPPTPDPLRFTGKERDTETGLDYFGARYYASRTGRFTTVDPVMNVDAALTDPQRWNRYAYAKNNPLVFIDPDGAEITTPAGFFTKAFQQQNADNLRALGKVLVNIGRSINSPGHMTPEAEARLFEQPDSAAEASRMRFFDLLLSAAPLLGLRGTAGAAGMIDASSVRFSQNSIAASFRGGGSVDELAAGLKSGSVDPKSIPPIRLVERDGKLYSLDNRRLYAAQKAGVKIPYRMATPDEILRERFKFTTVNDGTSVTVR